MNDENFRFIELTEKYQKIENFIELFRLKLDRTIEPEDVIYIRKTDKEGAKEQVIYLHTYLGLNQFIMSIVDLNLPFESDKIEVRCQGIKDSKRVLLMYHIKTEGKTLKIPEKSPKS